MSNLIGVLAFALTCGALDYARGRKWSKLMAAVYGLWIGSFAWVFWLVPDWWPWAFAALFALGASLGWGHPIALALDGATAQEPEGWQFHRVLVDSAPLALAARGALWAAPVLPLAYWHPALLGALVVIPAAFTAAPYLVRDVAAKRQWHYSTRWQAMEAARGLMVGLGFGLMFAYA
jgi:hypothetical protein